MGANTLIAHPKRNFRPNSGDLTVSECVFRNFQNPACGPYNRVSGFESSSGIVAQCGTPLLPEVKRVRFGRGVARAAVGSV